MKLDETSRVGLVGQLTERLRQAIAAGDYKPGDVLPTIRELAKELGTSVKVPAAAMKRLADEGLVRSRPRLGSVVQAKAGTRWKGHILLVVPSGDYVYLASMLVGALRTCFAAAGYLVTQVSALRSRPNVSFDLAPLKLALHGSVTFAVIVQPFAQIVDVVSKSGVPFAVIGAKEACAARGCVGSTINSDRSALDDFVNHCLRKGESRVTVVCKPDEPGKPVLVRLRKAGLEAEEFVVGIRTDLGRPEAVQRGALESFAGRLAAGWKPTGVLLFRDDWVCSGALTALLEAGVRIPADVKVVTLSNKGLGPVFSKSLTRMEMDHDLYASVVAEAVLAHLNGRKFPQGLVISPKYIAGETF